MMFWCPSPRMARITAADKHNIVVIGGDDVGRWDISAFAHGGLGDQTRLVTGCLAEHSRLSLHKTTLEYSFKLLSNFLLVNRPQALTSWTK